jgi:hypothetical protein
LNSIGKLPKCGKSYGLERRQYMFKFAGPGEIFSGCGLSATAACLRHVGVNAIKHPPIFICR